MSIRTRGFTLIELLVVIAIIGILSTVVLASLNNARVKSRDARRVADLKQISAAIELYNDSHSSYPAVLSTATLVTPGYMPVIPTDPSTGAGYLYAAYSSAGNAVCSGFHLGATLEDASSPYISSGAHGAASDTVCTGSAADFAGTGAVYDVKQ